MDNTQQQRLQSLIYKHGSQSLNTEEWIELQQLLADIDASEIADDGLMALWEEARRNPISMSQDLYERRLKARIAEEVPMEALPVVGNRRRYWWAAAAVLMLCLGAGGYLWYQKKTDMELAEQLKQPLQNDVLPGSNRAILTLADGSTIVLDRAKNGRLADQGNTTVLKVGDGQIAYDAAQGDEKVVTYNTISTPYGGQYVVVLADNSRVWLNAGSSLKFPTTFTGKERKVELMGEGYFEVAKDQSKPFHVKVQETDVEVLGTHFNINAYSDEGQIRTTLLEGSVKVESGDSHVLLQPGQQARMKGGITVAEVDTVQVVAWKNGLFNFQEADMATIMRQVARWYDVEVAFEAPVKDHFVAEIPRNMPVSSLLNLLQLTNRVHFRIEDKKIIVRP